MAKTPKTTKKAQGEPGLTYNDHSQQIHLKTTNLPDPNSLSQLEQVIPGAAREVLDEFKTQMAHERAMETRNHDRHDRHQGNEFHIDLIWSIGQLLGRILVVFWIGGFGVLGGYLLYLGETDWKTFGIFVTAVLPMVLGLFGKSGSKN